MATTKTFISSVGAKSQGRYSYYKMLSEVRQGDLVKVKRGVYASPEQLADAMVDIDKQEAEAWWNWDWKFWKPKDRKRNLVRAGALIAAALDKIQAQEDFEAWLTERNKKPHVSSKCVNDKTGEIISWVPRARNIGDNHYHFEDCTEEEVIEFRKEYMRTGECLHKCGHDEGAFCMERAVCDICGEGDLF
jgi:hypothetical protein